MRLSLWCPKHGSLEKDWIKLSPAIQRAALDNIHLGRTVYHVSTCGLRVEIEIVLED